MRILRIVYVPGPLHAAGVLHGIRVSHALARAGAEVTLHVSTNAVETAAELLDVFGLPDVERLHIVIHGQPFRPGPKPRLSKLHGTCFQIGRLLKLLFTDEKKRYDVYFARGYRLPAFHVLARRFLGYRVVYELHELNAFHDAVDADILAPTSAFDLERHVFLHADGIVSVSRTLLDVATQKWGAPRAATVIASGGDRFESAPLASGRPPRHVYYVGNVYTLSGVEHAIEAIAELPEATLTIVGTKGPGEPNHDRLAARITALGVADRVTLRGFVDPARLPDVYQEADILVAPYARTVRTAYFCSPLKIFEYMHARRPIVASDFPSIREILTDGESALLVEAESAEAIREALRRLMHDATLARALAERAYEDAARYTLERKCEAILAFFESIVSAPTEIVRP